MQCTVVLDLDPVVKIKVLQVSAARRIDFLAKPDSMSNAETQLSPWKPQLFKVRITVIASPLKQFSALVVTATSGLKQATRLRNARQRSARHPRPGRTLPRQAPRHQCRTCSLRSTAQTRYRRHAAYEKAG